MKNLSRDRKIVLVFMVVALLFAAGVVIYDQKNYTGGNHGEIRLRDATKYKNITFDVDSQWNDDYQIFVMTPVTENDDINKDLKKLVDDDVEQFKKDVDKLLADDKDDPLYDLHNSVDVNFASNDLINFVFVFSQNTGTDHDLLEFTRFYDRKSGERLEIDDFFEEDADYLARLSSLSRQELPNVLGDDYNEKNVNSGTTEKKANFNNFGVANEDAFFFDFEPGQVADQKVGIVRIEIPLSDLDDILDRKVEAKVFKAHVAELKRAEAQAKREAEAIANAKAQSFSSVNCNANKCAALTFDDGPGGPTNALLDTLKEYNVKATFFMVGQQAASQPATVRRVHNEGHEIGNHTWNHKDLTTLSKTAVEKQISDTARTVADAAGVRPVLIRPPYGAINDTIVNYLGAPIILWSVDPQDWKDRDADVVFERVVSNTVNGSIVLSHDIHPTTEQAYRRLVPQLLNEGFTLVTTSQLLGLDPVNPKPGKYFSR